ncbi:MAG: SPFH domain-containing protein [Butyrivibrio sp.]|nr:SPFH domain-containing protein [Butyrivibrio sp.]
MGFFGRQMSNVVEWEEYRDDVIFWKWNNNQIKKGSTLIIRPGQDAVFMCDGRIEGIFEDEGRYDIESQIIPFLSSLKGFKFGFKNEMRAEVLFVNTREFTVKWGTKSPVMIPSKDFPAGLAVRAFGTFNCKVSDYVAMIDKIAGIRDIYTIDDIRDRVISALGQLLMKWIGQTGGDILNLQQKADEIANGVKQDLDMQMFKDGITVTDFRIANFSYPEEVYEHLRQIK